MVKATIVPVSSDSLQGCLNIDNRKKILERRSSKVFGFQLYCTTFFSKNFTWCKKIGTKYTVIDVCILKLDEVFEKNTFCNIYLNIYSYNIMFSSQKGTNPFISSKPYSAIFSEFK